MHNFSNYFKKIKQNRKPATSQNQALWATPHYWLLRIPAADFLDTTSCITPTHTLHTHSPLPPALYTHTGFLPAKHICILLLLKFSKTKPLFTGSTEEMPSSKVTGTSRMWQVSQQKIFPKRSCLLIGQEEFNLKKHLCATLVAYTMRLWNTGALE